MNHPELAKLKSIKGLVLDVDGVLTDGSILVTESGEQLRSMNIKDGYALQFAVKQGLVIIVISGGNSEGVRSRLHKLGISEVHLGVENKVQKLNEVCDRIGLNLDELLYMGDDLPDLEAMTSCGLCASPADASWEILNISHIVTKPGGGKGAVREIIERILSVQELW